ncbi:MAG: aminoglycoside phosphotransferase family protein [Deltaproteobacteria bacterium]|nr:aminoglycoside phosphotransferase family protein [Deltaproteobacteria bacterium]MBW2413901.1 aminoglycoside phosphotransferase family protein [Deltaproteobacteria bacterium]
MKVDPLEGHEDLIEALRAAWHLPVRAVEFLPLGEDAAYGVDVRDGSRFHLKLAFPGRSADRIRDGFHLALMRQLDGGDVVAVPSVVPTCSGALWGEFGEALLVLSRWIDAPSLSPMRILPEPVRLPVARAIGALHSATGRLDLGSAPAEDFEIPFDTGLRAALERLDSDAPEELRRTVAPWRSRVEAELDALHAASERARALDPPAVLCHTDIHGGNLLFDAQRTLWMLDWDGAQLAPCEQDLAGATNAHIPRGEFRGFIDAYRERCQSRALEPVLFEFYFQRRCLEDLDAFLRSILSGDAGAEQDAFDLALIRSDCLGWIERMPDDVRFVRDALSGARA